jgi:hypothetical protein
MPKQALTDMNINGVLVNKNAIYLIIKISRFLYPANITQAMLVGVTDIVTLRVDTLQNDVGDWFYN